LHSALTHLINGNLQGEIAMNRSFKSILASFALAALGILGATSATAQVAQTTCVSGCMPTTPSVPSMGITVQGWTLSGAVGSGETTGIGKLVTGEAVTMTDEKFTLGADTFLTGNANRECTVNCSDSQSRLSIMGTSMVGAATVGYAQNDGSVTGCGTPACAPRAASLSSSGTNAMFKSSLMQHWTGTPAPTAPAH
jgi:hypothetical protein